MRALTIFLTILGLAAAGFIQAAEPGSQNAHDTRRGDTLLATYFKAQTADIAYDNNLLGFRTQEEWENKRAGYRQELLEMLGLNPLPKRTPLNAQITGTASGDGFTVEKLHFQARPGLYVTCNLYLPATKQGDDSKKAPAILYVCGHGRVKKNGVSYGNKTHYHHHGVWFARHGYVCLTIDTIQLGEIEGVHHGTYRMNRWWWLNRGYTPAGVEAWNCMRALDYLQSRPEVDGERIGVTGRSGGGAYSWWIAALDERIKAAVPVAGITDMQNHVVDGCIEGHCDCMFMVNTYRWDFAKVAALVAPRPLLISNTDRDRIFPLDGVVRTHAQVRHVYELYNKPQNIALHITAGPHQDTQELRIHAFRWLNHHLKGDDSLISTPAAKVFEPEDLKVFEKLPADEKVTTIDETFVDAPQHQPPQNDAAWMETKKEWMEALRTKVFRGWPATAGALGLKQVSSVDSGDVTFATYEFSSQTHVPLQLLVKHRKGLTKANRIELTVLNQPQWLQQEGKGAFKLWKGPQKGDIFGSPQNSRMPKGSEDAIAATLMPRGVGPTAFDASTKKQIQNRRRFYLLGQTLEAMQVFDTTRAVAALHSMKIAEDAPLELRGKESMAVIAMYAALMRPGVSRVSMTQPTTSHRDGPYFLNVSRFLDIPQAVALTAVQCEVAVQLDADSGAAALEYATQTQQNLKWKAKQLTIEAPQPATP